jgi:hypothetical protein
MANIKVNRLALIKELEAVRSNLLEQSKQLEAEWVEYDKAVKVWAAKVVKQGKEFEADAYGGDVVRVIAPKSLPKPKKPSEPRPSEKRYCYDFTKRGEYSSLNEVTARKVAEIDNTLKLLKLSSEDSVSATAYKSVAQYL